ncbi:hypothetical protein C0991_007454, partial [Blastosporella zonata]
MSHTGTTDAPTEPSNPTTTSTSTTMAAATIPDVENQLITKVDLRPCAPAMNIAEKLDVELDLYVLGCQPCPGEDCLSERKNWFFNDGIAKSFITNNVLESQKIHILSEETSAAKFTALENLYEVKDSQSAIQIQRRLFSLRAQEGEDIANHLVTLKKTWEQLNRVGDEDFHLTDRQFKTIIALSLPPSWDIITDPYLGRLKPNEVDSKKTMGSQEFIGVLTEKYKTWKLRAEEAKAPS